MNTYAPLSPATAKHIEQLMKQSSCIPEYRRLQCIYLRQFQMPALAVAKLVGFSISHVRNTWSLYHQKGLDGLLGEKRGQVRGKAHLSLEEEAELLAEFEKTAEKGQMTIARQIHEEHCKRVGKELHETVTYRLLKRHGWRKVKPRPHHPKQNKEEQAEFTAFFPPDRDAGESGSSAAWMPVPSDVSG